MHLINKFLKNNNEPNLLKMLMSLLETPHFTWETHSSTPEMRQFLKNNYDEQKHHILPFEAHQAYIPGALGLNMEINVSGNTLVLHYFAKKGV